MSAELKETVSKNIAELRVACKMTQLELGQALSYSDKAVSKWERGEAVPDAYVLLQMSRLFGVTVDYILTEHAEDDKPALVVKPHTTNRFVVALIAVTGIYMLGALIYVILTLASIVHPPVFMYTTVVAMIVLTVMNTIWGKRIYNLFIISGLVWSIILSLYFIFRYSGHNWWQFILLGIPAQVIVGLSFGLKREESKLFAILKKASKNEK